MSCSASPLPRQDPGTGNLVGLLNPLLSQLLKVEQSSQVTTLMERKMKCLSAENGKADQLFYIPARYLFTLNSGIEVDLFKG